jgi:hypothetical protein
MPEVKLDPLKSVVEIFDVVDPGVVYGSPAHVTRDEEDDP